MTVPQTSYAPKMPYGSRSLLCTPEGWQAFDRAVHGVPSDWRAVVVDRRDGTCSPFSGVIQTVGPPNYGRVDGTFVPARFAALTLWPESGKVLVVRNQERT